MAEGKYDDAIPAMRQQISDLQRQNQDMQKALNEVANANLISTSLDRGFNSLLAELQPLRDLTPQREPLPRPVANALSAMLDAMEGIKLPGGSLGIPEIHVPFIGQAVEPAPGTPSPGAPSLPAPGQPDPYQGPAGPKQPPLGGGYRS